MKSNNITQCDAFTLPESEVQVFLLKNSNGVEAKITNYGGIVMSVMVPDRNGNFANVVLGFDRVEDYRTEKYFKENPYLGAIVGRNVGLINNGQFTIDRIEYTLKKNFGSHHIHGGENGFDKVFWDCSIGKWEGQPRLILSYVSADGEEGYPGRVEVSVEYQLTDDNELRITYEASTNKKTIINLSNHSYFNLKGESQGDILDHELTMYASQYVDLNKDLIPTGEIKDVSNTPLDFRLGKLVGSMIEEDLDQIHFGEGYDTSFVLDENIPNVPTLGARIYHELTGRMMEVFTTQPCLHLYTANVLNNIVKENYCRRAALCLEGQHFPDAPNHINFPKTFVDVGETYSHKTIYKFSTK